MRNVEKAYLLCALLYMARGVIPIGTEQGDESQIAQFDATSFVIQGAIFAALAALLFVRWKSVASGIRVSGLLVALCGLAMASAGWSSEPIFTFRRAILLLAATMLGIYMATRFDLSEQLSLFGWLSVISVVGSFAMAVFLPHYGVSHDVHAGDWKGLFPHKNALGQQMAFGLIALAVGRPKGLARGGLMLSLFGAMLLLLLSRSATSAVVVVVIAAIYPLLHLLRLKKQGTLPLWLAFAPLICVGVVLVAMSRNVFFGALGREATLTGRTAIWSAVINAIGQRPWFGYGYAVFWRWGLQGDARDVLSAIHWDGLRQAQSGYLDLCLDLGLVGLSVFLCGFCLAAWRGLCLFRAGSTRAAKWPLIFLIFFLIYNFVESSLLQLYTFLWVPYVTAFVSLALMQNAERREFEFDQESSEEMIPVVTSF
jgi:O-antigen ligase